MNAFLVSPAAVQGDHLILDGAEARHCLRVLRLRPGEEVLALDGAGCAYRARIDTTTAATVVCAVLERLPGLHEPSRTVWVGLALLKHAAKFDIVVEKGTELGAAGFVPLRTAHGEREGANRDRWHRIAASAAKQCLRCRIPAIDPPRTVAEAIAAHPADLIVLAHERAPLHHSLHALLAERGATASALLLVGPEGGFDDPEVDAAHAAGAAVVSLGPRRLRSETAAIAATALLVGPAAAADDC